jgi:hypothetical protein
VTAAAKRSKRGDLSAAAARSRGQTATTMSPHQRGKSGHQMPRRNIRRGARPLWSRHWRRWARGRCNLLLLLETHKWVNVLKYTTVEPVRCIGLVDAFSKVLLELCRLSTNFFLSKF